MPGLALALLQLAAAQPELPPADIELTARVRAREVEVRQEGEASLRLRVSTGEAPPVEVERSAPAGAKSYRNLAITVRGAVRLADPNAAPPLPKQGNENETTPP
jgi:hypothetical protein